MGARCCKQMFGGDDTPPPSPSGTTHYHKFDDVPNTSPLRTTPDTFAGFTQTVTADGGRGGGSKTPIAKSCSSDSVEEKNKAKQSRSSTITKAPIPPPQSSGSKMLDSTAVVCLLGAGAFGSVSLVFTRFAEFGNASIRRPFGHAQSSTDLTAHNRTITSPTDFHGVEPPAAVSVPQHAPHHHYHHQRSHSQGQASALLPAQISPSLAKVHGSVDDITASLPPSQCGSFASTSFAQHNIIATGSSIFNPPHAAVIRFSVLKRISKARQAQFGSLVDLAADRFASARLRHPNIVRLIQAGRTSTDFLNMYEFALGGDVGKALSRKQSTLRDELKASWPGWESANTATRLKEFVKRGAEPQPPPKQCTCMALWQQVDNAQRHPSLPVDPQCPVMKWCATRTGLPLNFVSLTAFELLAAIHYLATHPQRFVHGDVKPDNIFINEYGHLQLGDFSTLVQLVQPAPPSPQKGPVKKTSSLFGRNSKKDEDSNSTGGRGTTPGPGSRGSPDGRNNTSFAGTNASAAMQAANPKYNPPEVVNATPNAPGPTVVPAGTTNVPEPNVDMWSYGVTLQELAAGSHPFYPFTVDINSLSGMSSVMNGVYTPIPVPELPSSESSEVADGVREVIERLNDLIRHCITVKPSDRYTATAASRHSFFRHPLVLTHLGVNPMDVATDAADYLVNMCAYPTREAAENDLFCDTDDGFQVDWNHIEAHATLRDAFSSVLWTQYVVQSSGHPGLRPPLVPSEHCVNGGFTLPEAVNLSLSGCDLFASFCGSEDSSTPVNSFGDGRMPPFVPVDLRFFCSTQAEFDSWTDEKNKKRLAQTDAELRADSGVEANVLRTPSNGSQNGRRVGGASHHVDQQPGYTYNPGNNMLAN